MSSYDMIQVLHRCPNCRADSQEYQTKSLGCNFDTFKLGDTVKTEGLEIIEGSFELYDFCKECQASYQGKAIVKEGKLVAIQHIVDGLEKTVAELCNQ